MTDADCCDPFNTKTGPVIAFGGTAAVSDVDVATLGVTPSAPRLVVKNTTLLELMLVPVKVTVVPGATLDGAIDVNVTGGGAIRLIVLTGKGVLSGCTNVNFPLVAWFVTPLNKLNCVVQPAALAICGKSTSAVPAPE